MFLSLKQLLLMLLLDALYVCYVIIYTKKTCGEHKFKAERVHCILFGSDEHNSQIWVKNMFSVFTIGS